MCIRDRYKGYSLLKVSILTGRTHQIRVHFSHMGYPIVGDKTYGGKSKYPKGISALLREKIDQFPRQALHASELEFIHPRTKQKVNFKISLPKDILELITFLKKGCINFLLTLTTIVLLFLSLITIPSKILFAILFFLV